MSSKEIAEHLNMPENTVKSNLQRALKILKTRLPLIAYLAVSLPVDDEHMITSNHKDNFPSAFHIHCGRLLF